MKEPTFDASGYPTEETLKAIREWPLADYGGWLSFCAAAWSLDYGRIDSRFDCIHFFTGGWSGNEDIIAAMQSCPLWTLHWQLGQRGGMYVLSKPIEKITL